MTSKPQREIRVEIYEPSQRPILSPRELAEARRKAPTRSLTAIERLALAEARIRELEEEIFQLRGGTRVYFMEFPQTIKIGTSINPGARARHLGGLLLGHIPGSSREEAEIHRLFRHIRLPQEGEGGTEHFAKSPDLFAFIDSQLSEARATRIARGPASGSGRA